MVLKQDQNLEEAVYIDALEFDKLATDVFNARLAQANLVTKTDFVIIIFSLNRKITSNKTKHVRVENILNKLNYIEYIEFLI